MWVERAADRPDLVADVAHRMRDWDAREIFATRLGSDVDQLVEDALATGPVSWVSGLERPIAVYGCAPMWQGVWSMWLLATDDFPRIGFSMTRLIVRSIVPMLFGAGAHRLEARSMEGHHDAQRWLEVIGAKREATLRGYGREGQDFHVYTWSKP